MGINIGEDHLKDLACILRCKIQEFFLTYLGLPIGVGQRKRVLEPGDRKNGEEIGFLER